MPGPKRRRTQRSSALLAALIAAVVGVTPATAAAAGPRASSELRDAEGVRHSAARAFDGLLKTGWAEGADGEGDGSWIELPFGRERQVASVSIWPGNLARGDRSIREHGRPRTVTISLLGGKGEPVTVTEHLADGAVEGAARVDIPITGPARGVRVTVDVTYAGGIHSSMFIAEVAVNFAAGEVPPEVERLATWQESASGKRARDADQAEVRGLADAVMAAEFGDRDKLRELMDRAGDGPKYLRSAVVSRVPAGFRVQALPPDLFAVDALLEIKDSNAIPAVELASLRSKGVIARRLGERAEMFRAYQDLLGGGPGNVAAWGRSGFEKGALQSFREPLDIAVDNFGGVYVADVANHRVQRYAIGRGIVEQSWGLDPDITNVWFHKTRAYYASGSRPGTDPGAFTHPVSLAVFPDKKAGDSVYVLDAKARVTRIGPDGSISGTFELPITDPISPGFGGEGHIVALKKSIVVLWANEGFEYDLEANELQRFDLADGAATGAVPMKGGKFGLVHGNDLILYSTDGFRHGGVLGDSLGEGFEWWAATVDERGKLWAVTDKGELIRYKSPGRVDFRVQMVDYSLYVPRLAVFDGIAFVTHEDRIIKVDALELAARAALEPRGEAAE